MMKWSRIGLVGLLSLLGCGGEATEQVQKPVETVEGEASQESAIAQSSVDVGEKAQIAEKAAPEKKAPSRRDRGAFRAPSAEGTAQGRASKPLTRAATRVAPPKGMDAHPDFVGARVGLIHTANVMGEVDPCG